MILQALMVYFVCWALWRLHRQAVLRSPLDNIPGPASDSFLKGNLYRMYGLTAPAYLEHLWSTYGRTFKIYGLLGERQLYVSDPLALYHIFVKDQDHWEETNTFIETNNLLFGKGLLSTMGTHHRKQRKMLNPVFSIQHMRHMIPTFYSVVYQARDAMKREISYDGQRVDVLPWLSRIALEIIGQAGLGYSFESFDRETSNPYTAAVKSFQPVAARLGVLRFTVHWWTRLGPPWLRRFILDMLPSKDLHAFRDIVDTMTNTSREVLEAKKRALAQGDEAVAQQIGEGKDIMSILLRANMEAKDDDKLPDDELFAQMSTLVFAAFDTTSYSLSRMLILLAHHTEWQDKLREEIVTARREKGDLDYDALSSLPVMEAVIRETLRLWAPLAHLTRVARKEIVLPLSMSLKGFDGTDLNSIVIPKDTNIMAGILGVNRAPEIWGPDAAEWKPERWLEPLPSSVANARVPGVYSNMMTFLAGSRACLGFKFSQMEMKVVLSLLLESFSFSPIDKEIAWTAGGLSWPRVPTESQSKAQLPLNIARLY